MDDPLDRLRLAFHEAGHVLAAVHLNIPVASVTVARAGDMAAHTAAPLPADVRYTEDALAVRIAHCAVVAAAGAAGEDEWWDGDDGLWLRGRNPELVERLRAAACSADDAKLAELAGLAAELAGRTDTGAWIDHCRAGAAVIVAASVSRLRVLAAELAARGTLTGAEIAAVLDAAL
jgi:hypothetical protein